MGQVPRQVARGGCGTQNREGRARIMSQSRLDLIPECRERVENLQGSQAGRDGPLKHWKRSSKRLPTIRENLGNQHLVTNLTTRLLLYGQQ
jgi:hypothetical protein